MVVSIIFRGHWYLTLEVAFVCVLFTARAASAQDFPGLYQKISADLKRCALEKGDPNLRLRCFDRIEAELDVDQKLFPSKVPPALPDLAPFDISVNSEDKKSVDRNEIVEIDQAVLERGRVNLEWLMNGSPP
jgi:hypothetical protein